MRTQNLTQILTQHGIDATLKTEVTDTADGVIEIADSTIEVEVGPDYVNVLEMQETGCRYHYNGNSAREIIEVVNGLVAVNDESAEDDANVA